MISDLSFIGSFEEAKPVRNRSPNFTVTEKRFIVQQVEKYRSMLSSRTGSVDFLREKQAIWQRVATEINKQHPHCVRTRQQIKKLWENLKFRAKAEGITVRDLIEKDAEKQDTNHHQFNNAYQSSPDQLQHATWSNNINGTTSAIVSNIDSTDRQSTPIDDDSSGGIFAAIEADVESDDMDDTPEPETHITLPIHIKSESAEPNTPSASRFSMPPLSRHDIHPSGYLSPNFPTSGMPSSSNKPLMFELDVKQLQNHKANLITEIEYLNSEKRLVELEIEQKRAALNHCNKELEVVRHKVQMLHQLLLKQV